VAKLTRLTHKIVIQLQLAARAILFAVLAPGSQSGNFCIYPCMLTNMHNPLQSIFASFMCVCFLHKIYIFTSGYEGNFM
jgi:hypothetical protein